LLVLPLNVEVTGSLIFGAGLVAIAFNDYARRSRPLSERRAAVVAAPRTERFGLAA
jgi:hypothetical protein